MKKSIIITSVLAAVSLHAVQTPNIGDVLKEVKPPKIKKEKPVLPSISEEKSEDLNKYDDANKVLIKSIVVTNAKKIKETELNKLISSYENKELSFRQMQELATKITKYYRQEGYFVARAYIPKQNIFKNDNTLTLDIIEGNYGKFMLENESLVKNSILQANLDDIKDKNIISTNTLERAMLIINDTPGAVVNKAEVKPGEKLGTSDFLIGVSPTQKYSGYILGDNYGSQYTGKHRLMFGADINSPFKIGDKVSFTGLTSEQIGLINGNLAYNFPILANGLRGELSVSKTTYELGSTFKDLDAVGTSDSINFKVSYPYIKSRLKNVELYSQISYNKMKDEIQTTSTVTRKRSSVLTLGVDYTEDRILFNKNSQTRANFSFTLGDLSFKNKEDEALDEAGAKTNGTFSKINIEVGQDFELTPKIKWENTLQMQYALNDKNLDGSQDLSIGGIYGVKYYPDGEQSAENGYIFNTEVLYSLPTYKNLSSSVSIFYDVGRVFASENFSDEEYKRLQSFGLGYYGSYKDLFINAHLAHNINNDIESQDDENNRFLVQAGWIF